MNDLKFACRQLLKNPYFTALAVLTLALGIRVNVNTEAFAEKITSESTEIPAAKELIERNLRAMGGREALLARKSYRATGAFELPQQNVRGSLEMFGKQPDKFWLKVEIPG